MADEKRRFSRINFDVKASLSVGDDDYQIESILNLSVGGCLVAIKHEFPVDTSCVFNLVLDGVTSGVRVHGTVVRSVDNEVSLQFTKVDPESLFHLQNILRYNSDNPDTIDKEIYDHPGLK